MRIEDKILGLLKEKPLLMSELQEQSQLSTNDTISVMAFLEKYNLVETMASSKHELMAKITERGLHLLNLPNLSEDETTTSSEFSEETIKRIREREDIRQRKIAGGENIK